MNFRAKCNKNVKKLSFVNFFSYLCTIVTNLFISNKYFSVKLPDSVTQIGENAFQYCQNIESITMNDNVTTLGTLAFYALINLKNITLSI